MDLQKDADLTAYQLPRAHYRSGRYSTREPCSVIIRHRPPETYLPVWRICSTICCNGKRYTYGERTATLHPTSVMDGGRYRLLCPQEYKQQYLDGVRCELYQEYEDFS